MAKGKRIPPKVREKIGAKVKAVKPRTGAKVKPGKK